MSVATKAKPPSGLANPDAAVKKNAPKNWSNSIRCSATFPKSASINLLTREEERELAIRVQEHGDPDAAYMLVTSNLRLVVKIALEFQRVWMQNLLDLIQEGNIGLMQAVKKFDPTRTSSFPTTPPSGSRPTS
jgi:DNA-directed RNA polymerase sigma subunit (sigma70/sigma32)